MYFIMSDYLGKVGLNSEGWGIRPILEEQSSGFVVSQLGSGYSHCAIELCIHCSSYFSSQSDQAWILVALHSVVSGSCTFEARSKEGSIRSFADHSVKPQQEEPPHTTRPDEIHPRGR